MSLSQTHHDPLVLDDRSSGDLRASLDSRWRGFSDRVMGGVSDERLSIDEVGDRSCLRLSGTVRLENNGGFIQMALDLAAGSRFDASSYRGVALEVHGNGERYNVHLRTDATGLPWQSYRATFEAGPHWQRIEIPFAEFEPYRLAEPLDRARLRRIAVVAIGRAFDADVCLGRLELFP
jgi:hypothetical protein